MNVNHFLRSNLIRRYLRIVVHDDVELDSLGNATFCPSGTHPVCFEKDTRKIAKKAQRKTNQKLKAQLAKEKKLALAARKAEALAKRQEKQEQKIACCIASSAWEGGGGQTFVEEDVPRRHVCGRRREG